MRTPTLLLPAALLLAAPLAAQANSIIFVHDLTARVFGPTAAYRATGELTDDEVGIVTPLAGGLPYAARAFSARRRSGRCSAISTATATSSSP